MKVSSTCNKRKFVVTARYRGIGPPIMQKTICTSLMFGTYDFYRRLLLYIKQHHSSCLSAWGLRGRSLAEETMLIRLFASSCSGLTEALLTPFERVQTLMQIPKYNDSFKNFLDAFKQLGLRECYIGFSAIAFRNMLGSGMFLFFREPVQRHLPQSSSSFVNLYPSSSPTYSFTSRLNDFLSGAVLGACISTLSFPFSVAKVQLQRDVEHRPGVSAFRAIKEVIV